MILFRWECVGGFTEPLPLSRYELVRPGLYGTLLFHNIFSVSATALLTTSGHLHIRHKGIVLPAPYFDSYPIYANGRIGLFQATEERFLPSVGTPPPVISLEGGNISGVAHHYYSPNLACQKMIGPGWYRIECWAAAGTDASDVDGLGELPDYNCANTQQFNVKVESL